MAAIKVSFNCIYKGEAIFITATTFRVPRTEQASIYTSIYRHGGLSRTLALIDGLEFPGEQSDLTPNPSPNYGEGLPDQVLLPSLPAERGRGLGKLSELTID